MANRFNYIAISNSVDDALILDRCSVNQIMVDTENIGKAVRQLGRNTVQNIHRIEDVSELKKAGVKAEIICRLNCFNPEIFKEIDTAILCGSDAIMLPMIEDMVNFCLMVEHVNGRVPIIPLIETPYSIFKIDEIINIARPNQVHIGLNDLYIALGMKNLFEVLLSPVLSATMLFLQGKVSIIGVGGIGDPLEVQKVNPIYLMEKYKDLGANSVILSRSFFTQGYSVNRITESLNILENFITGGVNDTLRTNLLKEIEKF